MKAIRLLGIVLLLCQFNQIPLQSAQRHGRRNDPLEMGRWKTYHNDRHGFSLRYPFTLQPVSEDYMIPDQKPPGDLGIWTYNPPRLRSALRLGFAPIKRDKLSAQIEIYVTHEVPKFFHLPPDIFLGLVPLPREKTGPAPSIGGLESTAIDVHDNEELIHNVFVAHNNRVYLFVIRNASPETWSQFEAMLATVRFTTPAY